MYPGQVDPSRHCHGQMAGFCLHSSWFTSGLQSVFANVGKASLYSTEQFIPSRRGKKPTKIWMGSRIDYLCFLQFIFMIAYYYSDEYLYLILGDEISWSCLNVPSELCGVLKKTSTFFRFRTGEAFGSAGIRLKVSFDFAIKDRASGSSENPEVVICWA